MLQKVTTHRVWAAFTGGSLSSSSCWKMTAETQTHTASISCSEQDVRWETGYEEAMLMGTREGRRNKKGEEMRQRSREKIWTTERGNKSWLIQTLRSHLNTDMRKCGRSHVSALWGGLCRLDSLYWRYDCVTHPSPSFSSTSKTSSGCLVRLSSLSFFNCLWGQKDRMRQERRGD